MGCVALAGYQLTLIDDPKALVMSSNSSSKSESPLQQPHLNNNGSRKSSLTPNSSYSQNASNIIQNNQILIQTISQIEKSGNMKSNDNNKIKDRTAEEAVIKPVSAKRKYKYTITGTPTNVVVKSILDTLVTPFMANKFANDDETEVMKTYVMLTINIYSFLN